MNAEDEEAATGAAEHAPTRDGQRSARRRGDRGSLSGRTLLHYRFGELLGAGGMGEVYRATDLRLRREIAIKVLPEEMSRQPRRLKRFQREAEILAGLKHPNIVTLFAVEEFEALRFLSLELIDGETLAERLPEAGLEVVEVLRYALPIARALAAAHERRITHRDLKPSNVMVESETGNVKVLDFGVAKESHEHELSKPPSTVDETVPMVTQAGGMVGTVPYMAPEQLRGEEATPRSDVFALGALLFELSTGRRPFEAISQAELMARIMRDDAPGLRQLRPRAPAMLESIVARCLEKEPAARYADAGEVARALEVLAAHLSSRSLTAPLVVRGLLPARRGARNLLLAGVAMAAVAAGAGLWAARPLLDRPPPVDEVRDFVRLVTVPMQIDGSLEYEHTVRGLEESLRHTLLEVPGLHLVDEGELANVSSSAGIELGDETRRSELLAQLGADAALYGVIDWSERELTGELTMRLVGTEELGLDWRQSYRSRPENRARINAEIAGDVARQLHLLRPGDVIEPTPMTSVAEAEAAYLRSLNLRRVGRLDEANEALQRAVELDPQFGLAWSELAVAEIDNHRNAGRCLPAPMIGDTIDRVERAIDHARQLAPNDSSRRVAEALYVGQVHQQPQRALQIFEQLLDSHPGRSDLLLGYALMQRSAGDGAAATETLRRAWSLHGTDPQVRDQLAWDRLTSRDYAEAEQMGRLLLSLVPGRTFALEVLQPALLAGGAPVEEVEALHRELESQGFTVHTRLALQLAVVREDWPLAAQRLLERRASRSIPEDEHGWLHAVDMPYAFLIARHQELAFDWRGEADVALRYLEAQFDQDPLDPVLRSMAALVAAALGDSERSRRYLARARELAANQWLYRARVLEYGVWIEVMNGEPRRAAEYLTEVLGLDFGSYWSETYVERDPTLTPALTALRRRGNGP